MRPIRFCTGPATRSRSTLSGEIVFHGRIDDQVKIRGFRVELGEIEAKLADLPGVAQAAVVLRNDDEIEQLVAFVVPSLDAEIDARLCATNCGKAAALHGAGTVRARQKPAEPRLRQDRPQGPEAE